jgi:DNA-binding NarL/FixJ family response regulator
MAGGELRVLIADDHPVVRSGIRRELEKEPDIEVAGEAGSAEETLLLARSLKPDVVLLDIFMPGMRAKELIRRILADSPGVRIVILTAYGEEALVFGLLKAGVMGYVLKEEERGAIADAIRAASRGEIWLSPRVAKVVARKAVGELPSLSEIEEGILELLAKGRSNLEIGRELFISERAVRYHLRKIYDKIGVNTRWEAIAWAIRRGFGIEEQGG